MEIEKRFLKVGLIVSSLFGALFGAQRYDSGIFLLGLDSILAIFIIKVSFWFFKDSISKKRFYNLKSVRVTLLLVFAFVFGEIFFISLFDNPLEYISDIVNSRASEDIIVLFSDSVDDVKGGWWIFFNLLDLGIMHFVLLVSFNDSFEKRVQKHYK
jgi:hypothetical protein